MVYKLLVGPTTCHAFQAWNTVSSHQMERLRSGERRWLRRLLKINRRSDGRYWSNAHLYKLAKLPRIDSFLIKNCLRSLDRASLSEFATVRDCLAESQPGSRYLCPADLLGALRGGRVYDPGGRLLLYHRKAYNKPGFVYNQAQ